jgi:uncharacterized protein involved in exopolysaccharide biosynthesis
MQLAERMQSELLRVDPEISLLQDRKLYLEAQLPLLKPNAALPADTPSGERTLTPEDRLRGLQAQYTSTAARYGADHPDIRRLKREIAALKTNIGAASSNLDSADTLTKLETELAALKERYSDGHPDVQRVQRSIAALKASQSGETTSPKRSSDATEATQRADNPVYIALASQLESTKRELSQLLGLRNDLRAKQRTYDARLLQIPEIEREYRNLTRDYDNAQSRYREVKAKQMQADVAVELEKGRKAERFTLGEPANLPEHPIRPNRPRILLFGLVASLGTGLGLAWLREMFDRSVKSPLELARTTSIPILTPIPYIQTARERRGKRWRAWFIGCFGLLVVAAFIVGVHLYLRPVPELLDAAVRRFHL